MADVFSRDGDTVTLRMPIEDWNLLLMLMGAAVAGVSDDKAALYDFIALVNRLNTGNPEWRP